ncbi:MAG TPA: HigA family addiction module antitoxin [Rhizomicrobium sp.]|jgi:addiction module HigA family antidote|nr:HigA family addiction module antitoxin [Rhizomicrobium sp.]
MTKMKNPSHPGDLVYWGILEPLDIAIGRAAELLGVRRATLSDLVNGKSALSAEMAYRIHKAFGPDPDMLMRVQAAYDMAQFRNTKQARNIKVKRYHRKAA